MAFLAVMAPPGGTGGGGSSPLAPLLMMGVIFVIFYFLLIRPQQGQAKKHQKMIASVKKGDRILTTGGLFGRVVHVHETMLVVQIAKDVNVEIQKNAIASVEAEKE